ncbi:2-hydroxyacid dehydrogenase [Vreelandella boliviensis]|uniref:2-hydroxyacid dehydrogenase n=1 Tax=Vreelandella boliviensis TaxID=223527 RepID=UPI001B8CDCED|nr:2-hydroxyacid dehydrogenase [Halomonas boliviensis]MBS3666964.1 NAD(P)-binding domain-containing protein [Halomonas boliviensis]
MNIVFHGKNAQTFFSDFAPLLEGDHAIKLLPDALESAEDISCYTSADIVVGVKYDSSLPALTKTKLFHVPGAGYDGLDFSLLPNKTIVCNCFGHEQAIIEYVMSALLLRHVPITDADERLRKGDWKYWAGGASGLRTELSSESIGIIGYGHIGKELANRAHAFGMDVSIANRSRVEASSHIKQSYALDDLSSMLKDVDIVVNTLPLSENTEGFIGQKEFKDMKKSAVFVNVGRGRVVDEKALFDALNESRIASAIIDTWYVYPAESDSNPLPASLPFHELDNVIMTPHMSGWTHGTVKRRQLTMARNINKLAKGEGDLVNIVSA